MSPQEIEPGRRSPPPNRDTHAFRHALALHRSGKLLEAERAYLAIVDADPRHADALRLAGVVAAQGGRLAEARDRLQRALAIDPQSADAHSNLGNVERAEGHHEAALASYDRAVVLKPHAAEILYNRGVLLADLGRLDEAIACFDRALAANARAFEIHYHRGLALYRVQRFEDALASFDRVLEANPDSPKALNNRGAALSSLKRYDEARMSLDRALAIDPAHAEALSNRGIALMGLRRFDDALESFDRALALTPDSPAMLANRASALLALRRHEEAIASCDSALALAPDFAEALNARGAALRHLGRHDEALASLERALALKPDFLEALNNRGGVLKEVQRYDEALASYDRALAHHPRFAEALQHRGAVLAHLSRHEEASNDFTRALELEPDLPFAAGALLRAKMQCCDWSGFDDACARINADVQAGKHAVDPFVFLGLQSSVTHQLQCARTWVDHAFRPASTALWTGERYRHDRIRLAYLSADFHDHPMAHLMAGLFEMHDRTRFETIAISLNEFGGSAIEARLQQAFGNFIVVARQTDREVAARLRELEVDIAVDLNGFTHGCRAGILALRPAPIQVNYLGYPGTMGAPYIDYIVADECVIPLEHRASFTEKIAYLPDTYQVNDSRRRIASATASRAEAGLPETGIVFCSFNASYKITPAMFDIWMRLLRDVDGSVLWLLRGNASVPRNLRREAMARGVAPERLVFADRVPLADHLARHRLADLFLDTLPYNAHTTASDALWAGLPVLTCLGTTFAGRVAASLNAAIGLSDLTTRTLRDYESLAFHLATDPVMLAETKQKLARHRESHPLFDTDRFRRHLEAAYIMMWKRYQRGEPPASFTTGSLA